MSAMGEMSGPVARCGGVALMLVLLAAPVSATFRFYTFEEPDWAAGDAFSDFEKFDAGDDTSGVIDVVELAGAPSQGAASAPLFPIGGGGAQALRLVYPGPGPSTAGRSRNNAMGNNARVDGRVWGAIDIYKGSGAQGFIWSLVWTRGTNASLMGLDGFFDTVRLRQENVAGQSFTLRDGWNQVVVMNDANANPNTTMWLNGFQVDQIHGTGQAQNLGAKLQRAALTQQGRIESEFDGEIFFDNLYGGNEPPITMGLEATAPSLSRLGLLLVILTLGVFGLASARRKIGFRAP